MAEDQYTLRVLTKIVPSMEFGHEEVRLIIFTTAKHEVSREWQLNVYDR